MAWMPPRLGGLTILLLAAGWEGSSAWSYGWRAPSPARNVSPRLLSSVGGGPLAGQVRPMQHVRAMTRLGAAPAQAVADEHIEAPGGTYDVDVAIVGAGPAGTVLAALLAQQHKLSVALIDPKMDKRWIPNYGVWLHEWKDIERILGFSMEHCLMRVWLNTDLFCGGSHDIPVNERLRVNKAYGRVDRAALRKELRGRAVAGGAKLLKTTVDVKSVRHTGTGSSFVCDDGASVHARMMVDCSGFGSKLVKLDGNLEPGVQVAYGIDCVVDKCAYDDNAMTLMDYRTNYIYDPADEAAANKEPTFMYAMPMRPSEDGKTHTIFFEETSLVARPPMTFDECKRRMYMRLKHLGVKVLEVEEEEFCYIPMGGSLPVTDQRVVAFGGAASMVHPSTGYHLCRALAGSGAAAKAIARELLKKSYNPDAASKAVYDAIWSHKTQRQRDFAMFGGEFLMIQDAVNLRGFFDSFFRLPEEYWTGFLAGWPGLTNNQYHETWDRRLLFGLQLFFLAPLSLKFALAKAGVLSGGYPFIRSVTPLAELGAPSSAVDNDTDALSPGPTMP